MHQGTDINDGFVDNLIEDDVETECLRAKPTCFIIVGRPGVGKSTLAKRIKESWNCVLIDDTDLLMTHIENETKEGIELLNILSEGGIAPEDLVLKLIIARLNSPDIEHYGYVLCCLPFLSEECMNIKEQIDLIKNLRMPPDFIINIKCADKDLVDKLSGLKQCPETGRLYTRNQWQQKELFSQKDSNDEEEEDKEEQGPEEEVKKCIYDQMVWLPENVNSNAMCRINMYKGSMLGLLEDYIAEHHPVYLLELDGGGTPEELYSSVMFYLNSLALKPVPVPVLLRQTDDEELPEDIDTEALLTHISTLRTVAPGFAWRRSRWGHICPVALKEGRISPGLPEFSVGFRDKFYIMSSQEAYKKFITNPRTYLLPPMPRPPCRVSIIGPPRAGKSTMCELLAQHYNAVVLNMDTLVQPVLANFEKERLDKVKEEATREAIEKIRMEMNSDGTDAAEVTENHPEVHAMVLVALEEARSMSTGPTTSMYTEALLQRVKEIEEDDCDADIKTGWVLDNFPRTRSQMQDLLQFGILPDTLFCLRDSDENHVLKRLYEVNKESIDKAVITRMLNEQAEKQNIGNQQEDKLHDEENKGSALLDDSDFGYPDGPEMNDCKLQLQQFVNEWKLMECPPSVAASELEIGNKSPEVLLQEMIRQMEKPFQYVPWELSDADLDQELEDLKATAELEREMRGGSDDEEEENEEDTTFRRLFGDTFHFCPVALKTHNVLCLGTDKIAARYRERTFFFFSPEARSSFLQNPAQFVPKTEPLKPPPVRVFILGTRGAGKTTNGEWLAKQLDIFYIKFRELLQMLIIPKTKEKIPRADEVDSAAADSLAHLEALITEARGGDAKEDVTARIQEEVFFTGEEKAIKAYLLEGHPLSPEILDRVLQPYWQAEPYRSTGFILEGFPTNPEEVEYIKQRQLFPDLVVVMEAEVSQVQKRLLPMYLEKWQVRLEQCKKQQSILHDLRKTSREENIAKRRAELRAERDNKLIDEDDDSMDNIDDEFEEILEEEFPPEEVDTEKEEVVGEASDRLEMEIEARFLTDEESLSEVMELMSEQNIPKVTINASQRLRVVQRQLLQQIQPLVTNRESLFHKCRPVSYPLADRLLLPSYKLHSGFGYLDPVERHKEWDMIHPLIWPPSSSYPLILHQYIYFFTSEENRNTFMLNPFKYLRQPKPSPAPPVKIAVVGPPKSGKTTVAQTFAQKYGLARLSIGSAMRKVLKNQKHTHLAVQMQNYLSQGLVVPDELAIQCLEVALLSSACSSRGYVLDGFPMTLKQAELMGHRSITPMIIVELELDTVDVLKRGIVDKMKPKKLHVMHNSAEILHIRSSCYKQEVEHVRHYFQQRHQNWTQLNAMKSKWWIWDSILKQVSVSMEHIRSYLERTRRGQAACIDRLCITPRELQCRLGEFGLYCPVCLALHHHLVDCSEVEALTHTAEHRGHYYKMCGKDHLESFLLTPDKFVSPGCPHTLPQPDQLPEKLTEIQVKSRFPQQAEMKGFCPVTYLEGKQRYEALVQGKIKYAAEYMGKIFVFETAQKRHKFMRTPETYLNQNLPVKVPPVCEPVSLTSLPVLGYLEQGVSVAIIKAMTAVGCLKPKYPFIAIQKSALLYVAFYLKAFNHNGTTYSREEYKKKLALFEEDCALIPYLSSTMRGNYKPPCERPIDFEFKLKRFLALKTSPEASSVL